MIHRPHPDVLHDFRDGLIDLAIGPLPAAGLAERFRVEPLIEVPLVVAAAPAQGLAGVRSLAPLVERGWVVQRAVDAPHDTLPELFARAGLPAPRRVLSCESASTAIQFIEGEGFVGLIPEQLALEAARAGRIERLAIEQVLPRRLIGMFHPLAAPLDASARVLYSAIRLAARRTQ